MTKLTRRKFFGKAEGNYRVEVTNNFEREDVDAINNFTKNLELFKLAIYNAASIRCKEKDALTTETRRIVEIEICRNGTVYLPYQLVAFFSTAGIPSRGKRDLYMELLTLIHDYQEHVAQGYKYLNGLLDTEPPADNTDS